MGFTEDLLPRGSRFGRWNFTTTDGSQNTDNVLVTPFTGMRCDLISFSCYFWTASSMNLTQMIYRLRLGGTDEFVIRWALGIQFFNWFASQEGRKGTVNGVWAFRWEPGAAAGPPAYQGEFRAEFQQL